MTVFFVVLLWVPSSWITKIRDTVIPFDELLLLHLNDE